MTQQAAIALGIGFDVLAANRDDSAARVVPETMLGNPDDPTAALAFSRNCDVITFDHEQVAVTVLEALTEGRSPAARNVAASSSVGAGAAEAPAGPGRPQLALAGPGLALAGADSP